MRRIISLVVATALVLVGIVWAVQMLLFAGQLRGRVLLAPVFMAVIGAIWLYSDITERFPKERR